LGCWAQVWVQGLVVRPCKSSRPCLFNMPKSCRSSWSSLFCFASRVGFKCVLRVWGLGFKVEASGVLIESTAPDRAVPIATILNLRTNIS